MLLRGFLFFIQVFFKDIIVYRIAVFCSIFISEYVEYNCLQLTIKIIIRPALFFVSDFFFQIVCIWGFYILRITDIWLANVVYWTLAFCHLWFFLENFLHISIWALGFNPYVFLFLCFVEQIVASISTFSVSITCLLQGVIKTML